MPGSIANVESNSINGSDSEDDFDWEEVEVGQAAAADASQLDAATVSSVHDYYASIHGPEEGPSEKPHLEITIKTQGKGKGDSKKNERALQLAAERAVRLECHKLHTVALLVSARVRNHWINDPLLHARLMSLTPMSLQNAFTMITKSRIPEPAKRGQAAEPTPKPDPKGKGKRRATDDDDGVDDEERYGIDGEKIRGEKSLMKHALMQKGSRDTSAQLFTALCRALGIPARLVVSLQSVPWQAGVGKPKPPGKKKKSAVEAGANGGSKSKGTGNAADAPPEREGDEDDEMEDVSIPEPAGSTGPRGRSLFPGEGQQLNGAAPSLSSKAQGKQKAVPIIRLRKNTAGFKLGSSVDAGTSRPRRREHTPDPTTSAPVFWTEVFSRADGRWIPVDPIRAIVNRRKAMDPTPNPNIKQDNRRAERVENRMVYVLAFEEDGYARDVTPRYAREYGAKVAKVQQGGKGRREWWERICGIVRRPFRLQRDDAEDEELQAHQMTEAMPTTVTGFKDHPLYVLERHLKREEIVEPPTELGKFRGESVYPRANVLQLKTAENWMRQGRTVVIGAQPLKMVKQRAVTVNRKRAIEAALEEQRERKPSGSSAARAEVVDEDGTLAVSIDGVTDVASLPGDGFGSEDGVMQGLYAKHQTELYRPPPVVDGKVPKNDFGNLDLYVPSMLPAGAVHLPYKGTAKIARQLGFDYAEAVVGFEFRKRRAFPVVTGVVVAAENESALLEAYWETEKAAEAKRRAKKQEQILKRWTKLVHGLRIRQRLIEQYADRTPTSPAAGGDDKRIRRGRAPKPPAGGFLAGADGIVQPFALPRNLTQVVEHARTSRAALGELARPDDGRSDDGFDGDDDVFQAVDVPPTDAAPKTMRELAEEAAQSRAGVPEVVEEELALVGAAPVPPARIGRGSRAKAAAAGSGTSAPRPGSNLARGTTAAAAPPAAAAKPKPKPKAKSTPAKTRGRKRKRSAAADRRRSGEGWQGGGGGTGTGVDAGAEDAQAEGWAAEEAEEAFRRAVAG
ncbi:Rad4-domain-containing protein [Epithele typhae]|uniref:Rad4-domain-containing protein n=1 Tax=Epithele typhae TaxID=378194 RepID=UPI0020089E7D|nr:Rad4-domain-containing protein [Epithele typhae]KAH9931640.1 Rad4-domain-containing protein [Epithele typhae]